MAAVKPRSLCWGSRGFRAWEEKGAAPAPGRLSRAGQGAGPAALQLLLSNTHCHSPCPSFLWTFFCCHPAQEKNLTTLASHPMDRAECAVTQGRTLPTFSHSQSGDEKTVKRAGRLQNLRESADWKVPGKTGPMPHRNALLFFGFEWPEVCKTSAVPEGIQRNSSRGVLHSQCPGSCLEGSGGVTHSQRRLFDGQC